MAGLKLTSGFKNIFRSYATALFIPGHKAQGAVSILTPALDNVDNLLKNLDKFKHNIESRSSSVDVLSFQANWNKMKQMNREKERLEEERTKISEQMKLLATNSKKSPESVAHMESLKKEGKLLREKLKQLSQAWNDIEETAMNEALALPNTTHQKTPEKCTVTYESNKPNHFDFAVKSHIDIGLKNNWLKPSPTEYYLRDSLAVWELKVSQAVARVLKSSGYSYMSAPDFAKSIIVDGCGLDFTDPEQVFIMKAVHDYGSVGSGNALHLVGGTSLPAFAAYFAKNVVESPLPLRYCGIGRQYSPGKTNFGLFNAAQATSVQFLACVENDSEILWNELIRIEDCLKTLLNQYNIPFRLVARSPRNLRKWEQYRSSIEMYSPFMNDYVEVGHISIIGDYISRRLAVYSPGNKHPGYVSGTALNVVKFLGCFVENHQRSDAGVDNATLLDC